MARVHVLFFLGATFLTVGRISAAPKKYDQRQEGEFNVHAQLENFLFIVAIPSNNDIFSELAMQALELKQHLGSSGGIIPSPSSKDQESDATLSTFNESNDEEVYITSTTETVQISEDHSDKKDLLQNAGEKNTEVSNTSSQQQQATTASTDEKARGEKAEDIVKAVRSAKSFEPTKSREMPILGYLVDPRALGSVMEDGGRARNVIRDVWNPEEPGRPDTSMKKQLFRRELDEQVATSSPDADENGATLVGEKQQELRLLGDGIENCGPGRRRDASGICEFDGSDDSFL